MGYDLKEGTYDTRALTDDEMWKSINWLFSTHSVNETSYKFLFFKSIMDCFELQDKTGKLSFETVFSRFTEISWNLVLKYGIQQKSVTIDHKECMLEQILYEYSMISLEEKYIPWLEVEERDRIRICKKVKTACKRYVVGALYSDMNELLYSFNKKEEWLILNPVMVDFIRFNKEIIENLHYYKWAKFYSSVNDKENENKLVFLKTDGFVRKNESLYRAMLAYEFERVPDKKADMVLPNTIEILMTADKIYTTSNEITMVVTEDEYEGELYESFDKMREYLKNPILLINRMKKKISGQQ